MSYLKAMLLVGFLAAGTVVAPRARANDYNQKTIVTFNEPVEIPGMVLESGTYVFRLLDTESDRDIVEVYNKDESHLYATLMGIPVEREQPSDKTVINFEHRAPETPQAVKAWFYPGTVEGVQFVYPRERAMQLAKLNKESVMSMPSDMQQCITTPTKSAQDAHVKALKKTHVKAMSQTGKETEVTTKHSRS